MKKKALIDLSYRLELTLPADFPTEEQLADFRKGMNPLATRETMIEHVARAIGHAGRLDPFVEGIGQMSELGIDWREIYDEWEVLPEEWADLHANE
jgi:hypothetical protein